MNILDRLVPHVEDGRDGNIPGGGSILQRFGWCAQLDLQGYDAGSWPGLALQDISVRGHGKERGRGCNNGRSFDRNVEKSTFLDLDAEVLPGGCLPKGVHNIHNSNNYAQTRLIPAFQEKLSPKTLEHVSPTVRNRFGA